MLCEAKREVFANYFKSFGLIGGKEFSVDPLCRFVEYFDTEYYDYNRDHLEALVKKTWMKNKKLIRKLLHVIMLHKLFLGKLTKTSSFGTYNTSLDKLDFHLDHNLWQK